VQVAAVAYELFADVVDGLGEVLGFPDEVSTARGVVWALALVLALVAVSVWLTGSGERCRWSLVILRSMTPGASR
jgi:hypothetical protein